MAVMEPIDLCLAGRISPQVAVSRLLLGGATPDAILAGLSARPSGPLRQALAALVTAHRAALERLATAMADGADHATLWGPAAAPADVAAFFDQAVAHSPEASVALYSLGDPAILAAATQEISDWLEQNGLLFSLSRWRERAGAELAKVPRPSLGRGMPAEGRVALASDGAFSTSSEPPSPCPLPPAGEGSFEAPAPDILDIGCGIGRMAAALAPRCRSFLGLDVSSGMVAEARRRHPQLRFETTDGTGLDALPADAFDLVLAIDSFPYIVQAGDAVAQAHIAGAARVLRAGGAFAILNLSYRGDPARDAADLARWCATAGLRASPASTPFTLWDGTAYVVRR